MTRRRFRQIDGRLVEIERAPRAGPVGPEIMPDIAPYQSVITGETIGSRSHHREHLKTHGMQEVGDSMPPFLRAKYEREGQRPEWGRDGRRRA